ncbi:DNA repair protein RadC [Pokkaliibacter sp. MBI-7]|uniref:RadC family protein n=1 Tax=Pokkaliibacter sp. MBI-7 TaxID=3040600 RepID=UPI0024486E51|nr:DNA repair protein RadC [Pokkaliibacter sp. MBI-7]MDH2431012.1 DNA repair protein RadC [Pokkaliibacter sp. MBI-7]MDH2436707.1 DNA repair protein RadC [Pokkaliibacter sp. MBI-7]MDH2436807.1 DNA repair protein RadC [Pokkaliibacter sp. MBI-7]
MSFSLSAEERAIIDQAKAILMGSLREPGASIHATDAARDYLWLQLAAHEREVFAVLFLDTRHRVISYDELFFGSLDKTRVYPREVIKLALQRNAAAVIFAHNHPSGDPAPSEADIAITQSLKTALALVDICLLDHIVIGREAVSSMAELELF